MADRPTLFSTPMVLALLREVEQPGDGKTQTRRLASSPLAKCQPGDRLWVREGWSVPFTFGDRSASAMAAACLEVGYKSPWAPIHYLADGCRINWGDWRESPPGKGRPSIHMPRWASRLTLVVKEVRFQQLQDITAEDAVAEGIDCANHLVVPMYRIYGETSENGLSPTTPDPREAYRHLWDSLHGSKPGEAWKDNPPVVALTFAVHAVNIDAMEAAHG